MLAVSQLTIFRQQRAVISGLSFTIDAPQKFFLQGEIGTGKSTLLWALLGFVPVQAGDIRWFGKSCKKEADFVPFRGKVGLCFQHADDQLFGPSVWDDVAFGCLNQGHNKEVAYQMALYQLQKLNIEHLKERPVNGLSGGEKNFVALAGVLAMQPKMLLLDEPTNGLDAKHCTKLTSLLQAMNLPMLIASHDQSFCDQLADKVLYLTK